VLHESYCAQTEAGEMAPLHLPHVGCREDSVHELDHEEIPARYSLQPGSIFLLVNFLSQKGPDRGLQDYPVQVSRWFRGM
jgi:hypothetical protein